jgi:RNA polymerase-binding protein
LPAGRDKENPPEMTKLEPYKTHLAYVKERRTEQEAEALLEDALRQLRIRRGKLVPQN